MKIFVTDIYGGLPHASKIINTKFNEYGIDAAKDLLQLECADGQWCTAIFKVANKDFDAYIAAFK